MILQIIRRSLVNIIIEPVAVKVVAVGTPLQQRSLLRVIPGIIIVRDLNGKPLGQIPMRLARPIYNKKGVLLYERDSRLNSQSISSVKNFGLLGVYVLEPAEPLPPISEEDLEFERFQVAKRISFGVFSFPMSCTMADCTVSSRSSTRTFITWVIMAQRMAVFRQCLQT